MNFISKEESFHEKVRLFKENMEKDSKKIAEILVRKPIVNSTTTVKEHGSVIEIIKS